MATRCIPRTLAAAATGLFVALALAGCSTNDSARGAKGDAVKLLPPPGGGVYLGQTETIERSRVTLESAIDKAAAIWARLDIVTGAEDVDGGALHFRLEEAKQAWDKGYVVVVNAYEAYPGHGSFTVDKLIRGHYDDDLTRLAAQFKAFGRPMIFHTAREANAILADFLGGFGPDGDQSGAQVSDHLGQFTPPSGPPGNAELFADLGKPDACDGLERFAAAQRYYHDFFTRREGIDFLTFETMGWLAMPGEGEDEPCGHWPSFYRMLEGYADWVSINWYVGDKTDVARKELAGMMELIRQAAPDMPVMITELGFCGDKVPEKIAEGLPSIIDDHPEIGAIISWGDDCLITPGPKANAFRKVMVARPSKFHSCAVFSDGSSPPDCDSYDSDSAEK